MLEENRRYNPAGYMGTDELGNELFYPNESDNYTQTHHHLLFSHQLSNSLSLNVAGYWIIGEGYYEQFKRNKKLADYGFTPFELNGETIEKFNLVRQKWLDNDLFGATYSLSYTKSKLNAILGGGWNRYNNNHFGNLLWADPTCKASNRSMTGNFLTPKGVFSINYRPIRRHFSRLPWRIASPAGPTLRML
jgi:iron complex outermembrane receptor protein